MRPTLETLLGSKKAAHDDLLLGPPMGPVLTDGRNPAIFSSKMAGKSTKEIEVSVFNGFTLMVFDSIVFNGF